jgi:hypothetical protein
MALGCVMERLVVEIVIDGFDSSNLMLHLIKIARCFR